MSSLVKNNQYNYQSNENFESNEVNEEEKEEKKLKRDLEDLEKINIQVIQKLREHVQMFNGIMRKYDIKIHLQLHTLSSYQLENCEELLNDGINHINMLLGAMNPIINDLKKAEKSYINEIKSSGTATRILTVFGLFLGVIPGLYFAYEGQNKISKYQNILNLIQKALYDINELLTKFKKIKEWMENRKEEYINFITNNSANNYIENSSLTIYINKDLNLNSHEKKLNANNNMFQAEKIEYNYSPVKKTIPIEKKNYNVIQKNKSNYSNVK